MKLAAKIILLFLFGVFGIVALFSWQMIQRQNAWSQQLRQTHATDLVKTLDPAIANAYREGGVVTIQKVVEVSTQKLSGPQMRWIADIDNAASQTQSIVRGVSRMSIARMETSPNFTYVPLTVDGDAAGAIEVRMPPEPDNAYLRESLFASVLSLVGVASLSGLVIFMGGIQLVGKPLEKLIVQVNAIGEGNFAQPVILTSNDELGRLAGAISQMSFRLSEQRDTIRHTDRLGTIGTLAAGVAHELGTPLNVVSGRAGLIATGKLSAEEVAASAHTIKSETERMTIIIRQLLDFARQTTAVFRPIEMGEIVMSTCDMMKPMATHADVKLITHIPDDPLFISGDAAQLKQVITNLIRNAIQAMPDGGVSMADLFTDDLQNVCLQVTDTGVGMKSEDVNRVFEPFFTTKDVGQGTGLGLSIAYGIVAEHGGEIKVNSQVGVGTTFRIVFPPSSPSQEHETGASE